jgi:small subunit ribosomal protein S17
MTAQAQVAPPETDRGQRKVRLGTVIADKMDKTVIVQVGASKSHRLYKKTVRQHAKFKVHDEKNECHVGDLVRISETRPISKEKRWVVEDILSRKLPVELPVDVPVDVPTTETETGGGAA